MKVKDIVALIKDIDQAEELKPYLGHKSPTVRDAAEKRSADLAKAEDAKAAEQAKAQAAKRVELPAPKMVEVTRTGWVRRDGRNVQFRKGDLLHGDDAAFMYRQHPERVKPFGA